MRNLLYSSLPIFQRATEEGEWIRAATTDKTSCRTVGSSYRSTDPGYSKDANFDAPPTSSTLFAFFQSQSLRIECCCSGALRTQSNAVASWLRFRQLNTNLLQLNINLKRLSFLQLLLVAALTAGLSLMEQSSPAFAAGKPQQRLATVVPTHGRALIHSAAFALTISPGGTTIQAAVNAASSGDTIILAPGTYSGPGNCDIDFGGKNLILQGQSGAAQTIIDCGGNSNANHRGFTFHSGETNAVLTNLTIENGEEDNNPGGAISITAGSTVTLNDCILTQNLINGFDGGGAISVTSGCGVTLTGCTLTGNTANGFGMGGGLQNNGTATLLNCILSDNYTFGGGTAIDNTGALTLTNCILTQNTGDYGTGSINNYGVATIIGCTISQNSGRYTGGIGNSGTLTLVNSLLTGNSAGFAGGIENSGNATITNCTLTQNTSGFGGYGGGLDYTRGTATLTNDILFGDAGVEITPNASGTVNATYCDIQGGYTGTNNVSVDPLFVKSPSDLHLTAISPCIGKGTKNAPAFSLTDKDGVAFRDPPSIGAYEGLPAASTATATVLGASPTTSLLDQTITFTAALAQAAGSDQAIYTSAALAAGNHTVTAVYSGDAEFAPSTAANVSVVVTNPVPTLISLSPTSALIGGAAFNLTLVGTGFNSSTSVRFNSDILMPAATSLTPTQMSVVVPAADIASGGPVSVIAVNAAPQGGTSNALIFSVGNPAPTITSLNPASAPINTMGLTLTINGTNFVAGATASFGTIIGLVPDAVSVTSTQMVTVQNSGETNAVNLTLITPKIKWGGQSPVSVSPATVPMLAPNSSITFMLQFPAAAAGTFVTLNGTYSGRSFSGLTRVTP